MHTMPVTQQKRFQDATGQSLPAGDDAQSRWQLLLSSLPICSGGVPDEITGYNGHWPLKHAAWFGKDRTDKIWSDKLHTIAGIYTSTFDSRHQKRRVLRPLLQTRHSKIHTLVLVPSLEVEVRVLGQQPVWGLHHMHQAQTRLLVKFA